jgi:hypothetical protein
MWECPPSLVAKEIVKCLQGWTSTSKSGLLVIQRLAPLSHKPWRGLSSVGVYKQTRVLSPKIPHTRGHPTMWTRLSSTRDGGCSCTPTSVVQESLCRSKLSTAHGEVAPAHSEESEPGGKYIVVWPNTSSSKPNTSSSAGKEKRMGES